MVLAVGDYWMVTECGWPGVRRSVEDSLQRLGLARLDAVYVHDCDAVTHGSRYPAVLRQVLDREFATVREGEALLTELWFGLQIAEAEAELGRPLNEAERAAVSAAHPMPYHLDFRMVK